jgi:hypothetical protein
MYIQRLFWAIYDLGLFDPVGNLRLKMSYVGIRRVSFVKQS